MVKYDQEFISFKEARKLIKNNNLIENLEEEIFEEEDE